MSVDSETPARDERVRDAEKSRARLMGRPRAMKEAGKISVFRALWTAGDHARDIAKQLGWAERSVYVRAAQLGLPNRCGNDWTTDDEERFKALWQNGYSVAYIASELHRSEGSIKQKRRWLRLAPRLRIVSTAAELVDEIAALSAALAKAKEPKPYKHGPLPQPKRYQIRRQASGETIEALVERADRRTEG